MKKRTSFQSILLDPKAFREWFSTYMDAMDSRVRFLRTKYSQPGNSLEHRMGDTLRETIDKWLVREWSQQDRAAAGAAALQYFQYRQARDLHSKNRRNALIPRGIKDEDAIRRVLADQPDLTWKEIGKAAQQLGLKVSDGGLKDRVVRVRKKLVMEMRVARETLEADQADEVAENEKRSSAPMRAH